MGVNQLIVPREDGCLQWGQKAGFLDRNESPGLYLKTVKAGPFLPWAIQKPGEDLDSSASLFFFHGQNKLDRMARTKATFMH